MSVINHEYKHVFIHVPKTAGTSMESMPFVGGDGHIEARHLFKRAPEDYFRWGFVRDPYDRMVSIYHAISQHPPRQQRQRIPLRIFKDFVKWVAADLVRAKGRFIHLTPQVDFLCDEELNLLVDFVGKYEDLKEGWKIVCNRLHVPPKPLPKKNSSRHGPWEEYYDSETYALVNDTYTSDFLTFNYKMR